MRLRMKTRSMELVHPNSLTVLTLLLLLMQLALCAPGGPALNTVTRLDAASPVSGQIAQAAACTIQEQNRIDCWPEGADVVQADCENRGCCWNNSQSQNGAPSCFFPTDYSGYIAQDIVPMRNGDDIVGLKAILTRNTSSPYPDDVPILQLLVYFETENRLHFKIFDPLNSRFEVPMNMPGIFNTSESDTQYAVHVQPDPFGITITRKSTGEILFDSVGIGPFIYANQLLQISTKLSTPFLYGLGEHRSRFLQDMQWQKMIIWTRDEFPREGINLYGAHPFYLNLESSGNAHGVFLLNVNAMQIDLQPFNNRGGLTYRTIGGILDFFIFLGPTPEDVVSQYVNIIGLPYMPPLWTLGFHLCRHEYGNSSAFKNIIARNRAANIPYDVQWNDLDYSQDSKDWTFDNITYVGLPDIIADLHAHGQHHIIIVDPGIAKNEPPGTYPPYDLGMTYDLFIKKEDGTPIVGEVWPGETVYPDFFHPKAFDYWYQLVSDFIKILAFDGLWIDMNEPSNFLNGSIADCPNNSWNHPPFKPPGIDGGLLYAKTLCGSALQYLSSHYNLHSLYGWSEARVTAHVLWKLLGKRTLVLSRSTAFGTGTYSGHWTGDNFSTFRDMHYSIAGILNFNLFGIPLVGADICGFNWDATRELCIRWMQLGSFYPFMRNHAEIGTVPQDPGSYDKEAQDMMRPAMELRYSLLPFLYTLFYYTNMTGRPIARPLFFDYPGTESIDTQFLWGRDLLISPVLEEGAVEVNAFIPNCTWYDIQDQTLLNGVGQTKLAAPLGKINVHVRGGSILPMLPPAVTTTLLRQGKMQLLVARDLTTQPSRAFGELYWDDGESLGVIERGLYTLVRFVLLENTLTSDVVSKGYSPVLLGKITVLGVFSSPQTLTFNGQSQVFTYNQTSKVLLIQDLSWDLVTPFSLTWS